LADSPETPGAPAPPAPAAPPEAPGERPLTREEHLALRRFFLGLREATPRAWVTPTLVGLCALVYVAQLGLSTLMAGDDPLVALGGNYGPLSLGSQPWRLLTSAFLHGGLIHIAFNMGALYQLGRLTERLYGNLPFLAIYLLCGLAGSLASAAMPEARISVGASGAVFGVVGASLVGLRRGGLQTSIAAFARSQRQLTSLVGINLVFGFVVPGIDNAAHLGGLAMGLLAGAAMSRRIPPPPGTAARQAGVAAALSVLLVGLYFMLGWRI